MFNLRSQGRFLACLAVYRPCCVLRRRHPGPGGGAGIGRARQAVRRFRSRRVPRALDTDQPLPRPKSCCARSRPGAETRNRSSMMNGPGVFGLGGRNLAPTSSRRRQPEGLAARRHEVQVQPAGNRETPDPRQGGPPLLLSRPGEGPLRAPPRTGPAVSLRPRPTSATSSKSANRELGLEPQQAPAEARRDSDLLFRLAGGADEDRKAEGSRAAPGPPPGRAGGQVVAIRERSLSYLTNELTGPVPAPCD